VALGDSVHTAARLASSAGEGEILASGTAPAGRQFASSDHALRWIDSCFILASFIGTSYRRSFMSTLVRWEPFRELGTLQSELSRLMNGMLEGNGRASQTWVPALDVWETPTEVVYAFDLPGIPEDRISIEVKDDNLTVSAEREKVDETSENGFYRFERRYGTFARAVGLPQGVDQENIAARYENGVLEVRVPKPEEQKPKKIELSKTIDA
jgi:HSP20 family protein